LSGRYFFSRQQIFVYSGFFLGGSRVSNPPPQRPLPIIWTELSS
jgi:hypothetical protein